MKYFVATKRKIYDDAKSGRYDSTKSAASHTRSHYQPSSRDYGTRYNSSRYNDYTSSKSYSPSSSFRGLFEKTFSRFFGGSFEKAVLCFIWFCLFFNVWVDLKALTMSDI